MKRNSIRNTLHGYRIAHRRYGLLNESFSARHKILPYMFWVRETSRSLETAQGIGNALYWSQ